MANLEERIAELENENKARKASYQIAGGKVAFVRQASDAYHFIGSNNIPVAVRIKFTPDKISENGTSLTSLYSQAYYDQALTLPVEDTTSYNEPQSGDGSVIINILSAHVPFLDLDYYYRVIATGPSKGTFTLL